MKKIKAILFDIDNTIGDSTKFLYDSHKENVEKITKGLKFDEITKEAMVMDLVNWALDGSRSNDEQYNTLKKKYNLNFTERFMKQSDWQRNSLKYFKLWPDTLKTIKELKRRGYKVGILSNGHHPLQYGKLHNTGIWDYMDEITISSEAGVSKPNKEIFDIACRRIGVKPEEAAYVGDLFSTDILGASRAKVLPIWIDRKNTYTESKVIKITKLSNLLKIFK